MSHMTLISLALLKARYDIEKKDVIDSLIPFVNKVILDKAPTKSFSDNQIKSWLESDFGLLIPIFSVQLILKRMSKRRIIERSHGEFNLINSDTDTHQFDSDRAKLISHHNATVSSLRDYVKTELKKKISDQEAESAIYSYIDQYAIDCIDAFSSGEVISEKGKSSDDWRYLVSSFLHYISKKKPDQFNYFVTVLTGRMLSNALLAEDLSSLPMQFKDTILYLDTPIILQVLGILGEDPENFAFEMISLFKKAEAKLAVFQHNLDETELILSNAERSLETESRGYGNVIVALREANKKPSDIALIRADLQTILNRHNIEVFPTPDYETSYQIDEVAFEKEMAEAKLFYRNIAAKLTDINSLRSIYILRKGNSPYCVEDCKAISVTTNSALCRAAFSYGKRFKEFKKISPIITDFSLTNIIWLKSPMNYVDIPKKILIAACYAAMKPTNELWTAFVMEIEKLKKRGKISEEQHKYLRYELRVRHDLMNMTFGGESELSESQILQILDRHEQNIVMPWKEKFEELKKEHLDAKNDLDGKQLRIVSFEKKAKKIGNIVEYIVRIFLLIIGILFIGFAQGWIFQGATTPSQFMVIFFKVCSYLYAVLVLINLIFGFKVWNPISLFAKSLNKITVKFFIEK